MAVPPSTYHSFSDLPPPPPPPPQPAEAVVPPPEPRAEPRPDPATRPDPAPSTTTVRVLESPPPPAQARPDRRRWPVVGGVLGLAAGLGLGFAYHDRLPDESAAVAPTPDARPRTADPDATAEARRRAEELEKAAADLESRGKQLDAAIASGKADADAAGPPAALLDDLNRVRKQLAELDRRAAVAPPPRPAGVAARPTEDAELAALREKKAVLGERLGPEHRDMLALDEQIRAAERRVAAARPKAPEPAPAPAPDAVEAERAALVAQAAALRERIDRSGIAATDLDLMRAERERNATARAAIATQLAALKAGPPQPAAAPGEPAPPPAAATTAAKPPLWQSLAPGGLIGLVVGAGLGYLAALVAPVAAYREPRAPAAPRPPKPARAARSAPADDAAAFGMPVLARVPAIRTDLPPEKRSGEGWDPVLVAFHRPTSPESEAFRAARRALAAALGNRGHVVVLVTGPGPGDGKTTVAANLALSLAQAGKRVILVDCDLRSPGVQGAFKLGRLGDGLRSVMTADTDLRMAVRTCEVGNLFLLPAGRGAMDPVDLLTRPKFRELIADLRAGYEYVLVDGPPATAEAELRALAGYADGAVLAVRAGADAASRAGWARDQLTEAGVKLLGAVVNVTHEGPDVAGGGRQPPVSRTEPGADAPRSPGERAAPEPSGGR